MDTNSKRFYKRLQKAFPTMGGQDIPMFVWNELKAYLKNPKLAEEVDAMSQDDFADWIDSVVPYIATKASERALKNKGTEYEAPFANAAQSIREGWPHLWTRDKFLKVLGRDADKSGVSPKNTVNGKIESDAHIGELDVNDIAALRNAGLEDDEIEMLANKFRNEYQEEIAEAAHKESVKENKDALRKLVREYYDNPFAQMLRTSNPEKWAMIRSDILNKNDRGAESGLEYLAKLDADGGYKDRLRDAAIVGPISLAPNAVARFAPEMAPVIGGAVGAVGAGIGDFVSDVASDYYDADPSKSAMVANAAGTIPTMAALLGSKLVQTGSGPLAKAGREANKVLRRGLDNPIIMEHSELNAMVDEAAELTKAAKVKGNGIVSTSNDEAVNSLVNKLNNTPKAIANGRAGTFNRVNVEAELSSAEGIKRLKSYFEPPTKSEYIANADLTKVEMPKAIQSKKPIEELSKSQQNKIKAANKKIEKVVEDKVKANEWIDAYKMTYPEGYKEITTVPATGKQKAINDVAVGLTNTAKYVGGYYEPLAIGRGSQTIGLPLEGSREVSLDKLATKQDWKNQDSTLVADPLFEDWLKNHKY